jgi:sterol desaturase/sphingolipid hydroxylase (fatty acid hydroxylase superfamily)
MVAGAAAVIYWFEWRRPLRRRVEPKLRRNVRNVAVSALAVAAVQMAEAPIARLISHEVSTRNWGLIAIGNPPLWIEVPLAVALMDYTLYVWHYLAHRVPLLWRMHVVHHSDLDLDASTALRFHFAEMLASVPWRAAQIAIIGVSPLALSVWQIFLGVSILFHHSELRLPIRWERLLSRLIVTPRMHGIHHSVIRDERDSNWSSGLTIWDRLHGTLRLNVPQQAITIGVAEYRTPAEVALPRLVTMPLTHVPVESSEALRRDTAPIQALDDEPAPQRSEQARLAPPAIGGPEWLAE